MSFITYFCCCSCSIELAHCIETKYLALFILDDISCSVDENSNLFSRDRIGKVADIIVCRQSDCYSLLVIFLPPDSHTFIRFFSFKHSYKNSKCLSFGQAFSRKKLSFTSLEKSSFTNILDINNKRWIKLCCVSKCTIFVFCRCWIPKLSICFSDNFSSFFSCKSVCWSV